LNQVVERVSNFIEASDFMSASLVAEAFLDDLTNWHVRRSRRRFWKSEHDTDKNTAYATLFHVLVKFGKTLAPFVPFVTEVMYQNLVRSVWPEAYESIHHTSWPQADPATSDDALLEQMSLARRVASLGLSAPRFSQPQGAATAQQGAGACRDSRFTAGAGGYRGGRAERQGFRVRRTGRRTGQLQSAAG
jgi:isoleucyl-tRNA synthetase